MSEPSKKMTMAELARLADVDVSTVSRALNDSPLVKSETKRLILKIADETGYAVNASARNLRRRSSEALGVIIPLRPESGQTISDPFFLEMVGAVSHAARARGYDLILSAPVDDTQSAETRLLKTGKADGLIVIGQAGRNDRLNELGPLASRIVVWGGEIAGHRYTLVGSDNVEGGRLAAAHLLGLGRRRILFVGDVGLPEVALRFEGLRRAHAAFGVALDPALVLKVDFGGEAAFERTTALIDSGLAFDAVFAASDVLAIAALNALRSRGVACPDAVSVVGYDNINAAAMATPALTTIDQNIQLGGELMVDLLLKQIAGEAVDSRLTPTRLVVRASCGAR